ncbi:MAG: transporter related [Anaeromyxobacteraceae bacterium]|nr:transporter related [Anaeromyxobacteraceae bacterium]
MISLRHIRKCFRDGEREVEVLRDLDLEVARGGFTAVVGPSGSGKSTLLYIAGALDADFEGDAVVAGRDLRSLSVRERAAFRNGSVGFVFQSFNLLPALPAVENTLLPGLFVPPGSPALPLGQLRARALEALDRVGLADKAERLPGRLSGGERQRVAIARALLSRPAVLLADEPTGNLDAVSGEAVIQLFSGMVRDGVTVLVVTHEERVSAAAGQVLHLENGRLR